MEVNLLHIDTNEPEEALRLLAQVVPAQRTTLNAAGYADYKWNTLAGKVVQAERKTWPEILASVDAVEDQLRRHKTKNPQIRTLFVLEGIVMVDASGVWSTKKSSSGTVLVRGHRGGDNLNRFYSWLYGASEYVEVYMTPDFAGTCQFLSAAYKRDQKEEEGKQFHRYFKEVNFHPLPQVKQLMGLVDNLGPKRAEALVNEFTTSWNVFSSEYACTACGHVEVPKALDVVPGIGPVLARTILERIGRTDV